MLKKLFVRKPDFIIGGHDNPYMLRWYVIPRNPIFNIYLHKFLRSDDDRALHDHMYVNCSIILKGSYLEHTKKGCSYRGAGQIVFRRPTTAHRIQLLSDCWWDMNKVCYRNNAAWTLFITGPRVREWGFHCPKGWRSWREFTSPADSGSIGKGCD